MGDNETSASTELLILLIFIATVAILTFVPITKSSFVIYSTCGLGDTTGWGLACTDSHALPALAGPPMLHR